MEKFDGLKFLPGVGSFLKEKRLKNGYKQEYVAEKIGGSHSNVAKYESGTVDIPFSKIPELCHLYQCKVSECGERIDSEMDFYSITEDAVKSAFATAQYMSLATGSDMVETEYEVIGEEEFIQLVQTVICFRDEELRRMELPSKDLKRLIKNFGFFIIEFIMKNEPDIRRRDRLLLLCNEALRKSNETMGFDEEDN